MQGRWKRRAGTGEKEGWKEEKEVIRKREE